MPPQEILHRARESYQTHRAAPEARVPSSPLWNGSETNGLRLVDLWRFFWDADVSQHCSEMAASAISGKLSVFGHYWSTSSKEWNVDPVTGYVWPSAPAHKIDYRHSSGADPKWTWEVNRLLFLVPVAFASEAGVVPRDEAEGAISATVMDWISNCGVGLGPQWAASIEVAIRSIAMTLAVQALPTLEEPFISAVGRSIRDHAAWIKRFPSAYSSANNHRVAELAALLLLDSSWTDILECDERIQAEQELLHVSRSLFTNDGLGTEQSPTYAGFSLEFLAMSVRVHAWADEGARQGIEQILSQAASALRELTNDDGSLIKYGDDDEGKVVSIAVPENHYAHSLVLLAGGHVGGRSMGLITFAEGGLSLLRFSEGAKDTTWTFDHGPLGFGGIAAHGHADVLSVTLRADGINWIVDPGTYRYHGDKMWRTYFRSSRAHNAPTLDELDSSVMTGDFNWHHKKRAQGRLVTSVTDGRRAQIAASHDGYEKLGCGSVRRTLTRLDSGRYRITDAHSGNSQLSTSFILNPECSLERREIGWVISHPESSFSLHISVSGYSRLTLERPEEQTAWFSPSFGAKVPTWRVGAICDRSSSPEINFDFVILDSLKMED